MPPIHTPKHFALSLDSLNACDIERARIFARLMEIEAEIANGRVEKRPGGIERRRELVAEKMRLGRLMGVIRDRRQVLYLASARPFGEFVVDAARDMLPPDTFDALLADARRLRDAAARRASQPGDAMPPANAQFSRGATR